jgi:hypothetical protein
LVEPVDPPPPAKMFQGSAKFADDWASAAPTSAIVAIRPNRPGLTFRTAGLLFEILE